MNMFNNMESLIGSFMDGKPGNDIADWVHQRFGGGAPTDMTVGTPYQDPPLDDGDPPPIPQPPHGGLIHKLLSIFGGGA